MHDEEKEDQSSPYRKKSLSFPQKKNKIRSKKHFTYIFSKGRRAGTQCIGICYIKAFQSTGSVAFCVRKNVGNAVKRNFCKRRLRSIYQEFQSNINKKYDIVFIAKETLVNEKFEKVKRDLNQLLKNNMIVTFNQKP